MRQILRASFVSLVLLACENGGNDSTGTDATGAGTDATGSGTDATGTDATGSGTDATTIEPTTTTPPTTSTDDTATDATATTGTDDTGPSGLSFAVDVYAPIIMPSCSCHVGGSGGMTLGNDAGTAFAAIVGVASNDVPAMSRVEPGDSANSYLFHKVEGTHLDVGGDGSQMPLGGQLDPAQIDTIKQWIDGGAQP